MVAKRCILNHPLLKPLDHIIPSIRMLEKMIQPAMVHVVHVGEIGGKDPCIIRTLLPQGCEYSLLENEVCRATQFTVPASSRAEEKLLCKILFLFAGGFNDAC